MVISLQILIIWGDITMYIPSLRPDQWDRIKDLLPGKKGDRGCTAKDNKGFIEASLWIARNGGKWRSLPPEYGKWSSVHRRFKRWADKGVWDMLFQTLSKDTDTEWVMIDSTIIRSHQDASGAKGGKKNTQ